MKLFLTADDHIGLRYASHEQAAELAQARITAFSAMVEKANEEGCELFVIAGDLFENTYSISRRDIKALLDILSMFRGMVTILPGNHDHYDEDVKLWRSFSELSSSFNNILLLTQYRPYPLKVGEHDIVLYPALCRSVHSAPGENNLGWIREQTMEEDAYHIGIAHGAVEGETIDKEGHYFQMSRSELESIPVDVWLIGHTHVPFPRDMKENDLSESGRIFNAGTHVQTDVSCNTEGQCFIIELDAQKTVRAKKFSSGTLRFYRMDVEVSAGCLRSKLDDVLCELGDKSVVELSLHGAVSAQEYEQRREILDAVLGRFLESRYQDSGLSKLISEELIDAEFPETSFSALLLKELIQEPKEAQLVYDLLRSMKEGRS